LFMRKTAESKCAIIIEEKLTFNARSTGSRHRSNCVVARFKVVVLSFFQYNCDNCCP